MASKVAAILFVGSLITLMDLSAAETNTRQSKAQGKSDQKQASAEKSKEPVWVPTHWGWRGEWVKVPGQWKYPENEKETAWEDSRFVKKGNERLWVPGHWKEEEKE